MSSAKKIMLTVFLCLTLALTVVCNVMLWDQVDASSKQHTAIVEINDMLQQQIEQSIDNRQKTTGTKMLKMDPFITLVSDFLENGGEDGKVSAFIAMDGDHFGTLKETYGDEFTNEIVLTLAACLKENFPDAENDILCNVGDQSDEIYVFLMNRSSSEEIEAEIADFLNDFRSYTYDYNGQPIKATCSAGIAIFPKDGQDFATLYKAADEAMYEAKEGGRDRYVIYGS